MDELSAVLVRKALDGLMMRQNYIAQNLANAGTEGYVPARVTFENELQAVSTKGIESIRAVDPQVTYVNSDALAAEMRIDLELARASQTAMRYAALIDLRARQTSLGMSVVQGGQR
ncbi:MAG: hypothetical protein AAGA08_16760 [Pseudomonadota bacterium]